MLSFLFVTTLHATLFLTHPEKNKKKNEAPLHRNIKSPQRKKDRGQEQTKEEARTSSPLDVPDQKRTDDAGGDSDAADDGDPHQPLLRDLVVHQLAQVRGLQVRGLLLEEEIVIAAGLAVVAELVVAEGEVVEALAAALGGDAEDLGEEADA